MFLKLPGSAFLAAQAGVVALLSAMAPAAAQGAPKPRPWAEEVSDAIVRGPAATPARDSRAGSSGRGPGNAAQSGGGSQSDGGGRGGASSGAGNNASASGAGRGNAGGHENAGGNGGGAGHGKGQDNGNGRGADR